MTSECPRCGSELTTLALADTEAVACESCGYVGVEADHTGEPRSVESWDDALQRFEAKYSAETRVRADDSGHEADSEPDSDTETAPPEETQSTEE